MEHFDFGTAGLLLGITAAVAMLCHRLRIPTSVGLVSAGVLIALLPIGLDLPFTPDLIYFVFLPPLVFEAAIQIPWRPFLREMPPLLLLVTLGVALAATVVAAGMHYALGWGWLGAAFFGVLISATDPVSVIAAFKTMRVDHRLHLLVESESLLNDGVAAVGFAILVAIAAGGEAGPGDIALRLAVTVLGGVAAGAAVAVPLILIAGRTTDRLVEITLTMLIAYGAFLLAEHFHVSGVLATLTAGLIVGNYGFLGAISKDGRVGVLDHWGYLAFLINSLIFLMIGSREAAMPIGAVLIEAALATLLVLAGRAATVYPVSLLFLPTRLRIPLNYQHVLFWGGLRGALALALALALPANIPERAAIITVAFVVVAFSIFVQGLTMPVLIRRLGLLRDEDQGTSTVSTASDNVSG